jgi:phosphate transport system permease protein
MSVAMSPASPSEVPPDDAPRRIVDRPTHSDRIFRNILRAAGLAVLVMTAAILLFLILRASTAFKAEGFRFFTTSTLNYATNQFGVAALLPDTFVIAIIALVIAVPAGIAAALFISEYAPLGLRRPLIAVIDLLAATPSIVFALWGLFFLMPHILGTSSWLADHLGFLPFFHVSGAHSPQTFVASMFIAGVVVSLMVIPIITSLSRQVFSQAPQGEREAAYALGATRWGMVRTVVLPFGRAGMIGASMLGLGRALGETIAVSFILTPNLGFNLHVLQSGGNSITAEVANNIFDIDQKGISFLFAAALVLFAMTLVLNTLASVVINRSRSGAATEAD